MLNNNYHVVKLFYPTKTKDNLPIESGLSTKIYKSICKDIIQLSGGLTVYPGNGLYLKSNGDLITEDISILSVYTDQLESMINLMHYWSSIILKSLDQETVLLEIDNRPEFINDLSDQEL